MSVVVTVTETTGNTITVTTDEVIVTTNTLAIADASQIAITPVAGTDIDATNIQDALHQLADQKFRGSSAPSSSDANLEEGDLWYDTTNDLLKVYRNTTWEELVIAAQLAEGSGATEYKDVNLNGGYF
jgi:S1-C subfamily serine protease